MLLPIVLLAITLGHDAHAQTPEEKGLAIAGEMDRRDSGWKDQRANLVMTLRNRQGQESRRELRISTLEVDGDGEPELQIVKTKRFHLGPLSPEEAALKMDLMGHGFFFFINSATGRSAVVYRRDDGAVGLIDEAG